MSARAMCGMKAKQLALALVVFALLGANGPGEKAKDFTLRDLSGKSVKLSSLLGKVVLVDFWASWCEPCKRELPLLHDLAKRLRPRGIEVLAVNIDRERGNAEAFLRARGLDLLTVLFNPDLSVADLYKPAKMPSSFVIDKQGKIRYVNAGFEPGDEKKVEQQLLDLVGR